jgi:hypothetical protein
LNPGEGMEIRLLCCCVGSDLSDELITLSEESYRVCVCVCLSLIVCDLGTSTVRRPRPHLGWLRHKEKENIVMKDGEDGHEN